MVRNLREVSSHGITKIVISTTAGLGSQARQQIVRNRPGSCLAEEEIGQGSFRSSRSGRGFLRRNRWKYCRLLFGYSEIGNAFCIGRRSTIDLFHATCSWLRRLWIQSRAGQLNERVSTANGNAGPIARQQNHSRPSLMAHHPQRRDRYLTISIVSIPLSLSVGLWRFGLGSFSHGVSLPRRNTLCLLFRNASVTQKGRTDDLNSPPSKKARTKLFRRSRAIQGRQGNAHFAGILFREGVVRESVSGVRHDYLT